MARRHIEDYKAAAAKLPTLLRRSGNGRWVPPKMGVLKLNSYASCLLGCGIGLGGVLCGDRGQVQ